MKNSVRSNEPVALFLGVASFAFLSLSLSLSLSYSIALAAPPSSPYTPGETLNPTCSPGDSNCTVVAPPAGTGAAGLLTYWTATSTVSSSLSLFWDNPNIRLGIGTSQPSSTLHIIAGTTGATTLQLMGLPNQTGNLLSISSSSGQRYFTISSLGLASSTEFRSPSSTIDTLTLTSASSTGNLTIGGTLQANAGQSTFSNVSSTNLDVGTRFNFAAASSTGNVTLGGANTQILNQLTFANASGTNLFLSGYITATTSTLGTTTVTGFTFTSASSSQNITIGGTFQSNAGQTTLASVSSTNLFGSGYLNFVSGRADLQAVSSTNFSASGYGLFATLLAQNAVGLGSLSSSTSLVFVQGTQVGSTTLNIRGFTNQTANLFIVASSTGTTYFTIDQIGNVSSTQNLTIGGAFQSNAGQSTFGSVSSTNAYHNGYLTVTGVTTVGNDLVFSGNNVIRRNTSDGSDTGKITLAGGGASGDTRGGQLIVYGNENNTDTAVGYVTAQIGAVNNAYFQVAGGTGNANHLLILGNDGSATFTSSKTAATWTFNSTHANGGDIEINTSGSTVFKIGSTKAIDGSGTATTGGIVAITWPTSASAANAVLGDGDYLRRSTSSKRYKQDIKYLTLADVKDVVMGLRPVTYRGINPTDSQRLWPGFIAEDVQQIAPILDTYDDGIMGGLPNYVIYDRIPAFLVPVIQDHEHQLASLSFRVEDLERIIASQSTSFGQTRDNSSVFASVISAFQNAYDIVFDKGLLKVAHLITDLIETKDIKVQNGVTTNDKLTGEEYCISVQGGQVGAVKGFCTSSAASVSETSTSTTSEATSTTETTTEEISTSTPETAP